MSIFSYKAKTGPSEIRTGTLEAASIPDAVRIILSQGLSPLEVVPYQNSIQTAGGETKAQTGFLSYHLSKKISLKTLSHFTLQLYDLVDAGVPIIRSLEILGRSSVNPELGEVIRKIRESLQSGESLSSAMSAHSSVFPSYYIHMVRSGESSGHLPKILARLSDTIEKDIYFRSKVIGSLMYPLIVFGVGVLTFIVLLTVVMPKLTALFEDFDAALPLPTQIVIGFSHFVVSFWWAIVLVIACGIFFGERYLLSPEGRKNVDAFILRVPVLSQFIRQAEMMRVARTLGTLLEGGVPIAVALESVVHLVSNKIIQDEIRNVARDVRGGNSLTQALRKAEVYWSESAVSMIAVGEESGKLEKGLYKLSLMMERETEQTASLFVTLLGPVVLLCVVGGIGAMIVAILLPLFQANMIVQ